MSEHEIMWLGRQPAPLRPEALPTEDPAFETAVRRICEAVEGAPLIVFAKGAGWQLDRLATLPCAALGIDWHTPIAEARLRAPDHVLQGNLDPSTLYGTESEVRAATQRMLSDFGRGGHVANLGHGVYPDIDPDRVRAFIDEVKRSGVEG